MELLIKCLKPSVCGLIVCRIGGASFYLGSSFVELIHGKVFLIKVGLKAINLWMWSAVVKTFWSIDHTDLNKQWRPVINSLKRSVIVCRMLAAALYLGSCFFGRIPEYV